MVRIFLEFVGAEGSEIALDHDLSHHLRDVLRLSQGATLVVVNKHTQQEYSAFVSEIKPRAAVLVRLVSPALGSDVEQNHILKSLICALPKGNHSDQICEQVAQFGIERIIFWKADRSIVQPKQIDNKLGRWKKLSEASARQSQSKRIPEVLYFNSSAELIAWIESSLNLKTNSLILASLLPQAKHITELARPEVGAHVIIGPEGDFTPDEIKCFENLGAVHMSLGPLILRVETAALAAVASVLALWGGRDRE